MLMLNKISESESESELQQLSELKVVSYDNLQRSPNKSFPLLSLLDDKFTDSIAALIM